MAFDPFAENTNSPWDAPSTATDTKESPNMAADNEAFTITLKFSGDYAAPWTVVRAPDAETAKQRIAEARESGLLDLVAKAGSHVNSLFAPISKAAAPARQASSPASSGGGDYTCAHGNRNFKDGGSWAAYFCGAGRDVAKADQCEPLWRQKDGSFKARGK